MKDNGKLALLVAKQSEVSRRIEEEFPFVRDNSIRDMTLYEQLSDIESRLLFVAEEQEKSEKRMKTILPTISNLMDRDLFIDDEQYKASGRRKFISTEREIARRLSSLLMTSKVRRIFIEKDLKLIEYENTLSDNEDKLESYRLSKLSFRRAFY